MRAIVRVGSQHPFQHVAAPVTGSPNNQVAHVPFQIAAKIAALEGGLLRKINILVRVRIVNRGKGVDAAGIKVKCRTINIGARGGIT